MENLKENLFTKRRVANTLAVLSTATIAFTIALMLPGNVTAQDAPKKGGHPSSSTATLVCDAGAGGTADIGLYDAVGTLVGSGSVTCGTSKTHGDRASEKIPTFADAVSAIATGVCPASGDLPFTAFCGGYKLTVK